MPQPSLSVGAFYLPLCCENFFSELVHRYVEQGSEVGGHRENIDFIAGIIRQELTAIY